ncbi:MAG: hypothetical protein HYX69_20040 [Planctomycetia bacterium]|nr:hypothetical protein [Planctomycetia bacterium]
METRSDSPPALARFLDNFLQDRNIKWILGIGAAILLGSSLMLVSSQWEGYSAAAKQLILLGYTALIFGAGSWSYHRLALRRTGTILLALAVLLLPVACWALGWVRLAAAEGTTAAGVFEALLVLSGLFTVLAAGNVFKHFFRGPHPTFLACYVTLALAGAIAPAVHGAWSVTGALLLWAAYAVGSIKINRHVFWLTEERQAPRIFGFFPIAMLAAQFLAVFAASFGRSFSLDWLGLGGVLMAIPILQAADAVSRVFKQRTGDLVRPIPWPIALPLVLGVLLCAAGVVLSGAGLATGQLPFALVPTAALAAAVLGVVAHRTGKEAFVWAMLVALTLAYRYVPVFFADLAQQAVQGVAIAVHEPKMPWAYYGLTFLPLLVATTSASAWATRRGQELFARPMRLYAIGLAMLLLSAAPTHAKAFFPVAVAMSGLFAAQTIVFRNRGLAIPALLATSLAAWGFAPFVEAVFAVSLPAAASMTCLLVLAATLLVWGGRVDRIMAPLPVRVAGLQTDDDVDTSTRHLCQHASLLLTLGAAVAWIVARQEHDPFFATWPNAVAIAALLFAHAFRWLRTPLGVVSFAFTTAAATMLALDSGGAMPTVVSALTLVWLGQWIAGYALRRFSRARISQAFAPANEMVATFGLVTSLLFAVLPAFVADVIPGIAALTLAPWWACRVLILFWVFDAARRHLSPTLAAVGYAAVVVCATSLAVLVGGSESFHWLPALWAAMATAAIPLATMLRRRHESIVTQASFATLPAAARTAAAWRALGQPLDYLIPGGLLTLSVGLLPLLSPELRLAGLVAPVGLLAWSRAVKSGPAKMLSLALFNWQLIATVVWFVPPGAWERGVLEGIDVVASCLPVALTAAVSALAWSRFASPDLAGGAVRPGMAGLPNLSRDVATIQEVGLRVVTGVSLAGSLFLSVLGPLSLVMAMAAFAMVVAHEARSAYVTQSSDRVWTAELVAGLAIAYLVIFGIVPIGQPYAMFVVLVLGVLAWTVGRGLRRRGRFDVFAQPLELTGAILPLVTTALGVARHLHVIGAPGPVTWLGTNSLAILLAAGLYFWQAVETRRKSFFVLSAAVANSALCLLWRELAFTDPQFFMIPIGASILGLVQLLKNDLPEDLRDPLRYLGALVILVSPTFHIVDGVWLHLLTLMLASVALVLLAIGLRVRALVYTGTAFLVADIMGMVARGSIDHPNLLWIAGLAFGAGVVTLGAFCELHREKLLQQLRALTAALAAWD